MNESDLNGLFALTAIALIFYGPILTGHMVRRMRRRMKWYRA